MHTLLLFAMLVQSPAPVVEIPFTVNRCGMPVITITVDGEKLEMVVDTASTRTRLANEYRTEENQSNPIILMLSDTKAVQVKLGFIDLTEARKDCGKMDGLLGNEVLSGAHSLTLDYKHKRFILNYGLNH